MLSTLPKLVVFALALNARNFVDAAATGGSASAPVVDLGYAQYQGALDTTTNITSFLSIRYAAPPLGAAATAHDCRGSTGRNEPRFMLPKHGLGPPILHPCLSMDSTSVKAPLRLLRRIPYLNVFVPGEMPAEPAAPGTGLPVLVWIHGGGYVEGYAEEFDGTELVADSHNGVVTVVVQYRLGAFVNERASSSSTPTVDLGYAQYQGTLDSVTNITSFLSISYAAPPTGNLRFQAPQPPLTVSGIQQATANPNSCYQAGFGEANYSPVSIYGYNKRQSTTPESSEDCLYLNVFVPGEIPFEPITPDTGLPVLVWIHGGGYVAGYAEEFDGADLILDSHNGAVVVIIQYRLGAFGFLAGTEMKESGALNAGLLDQRYALEWVQEHISLFGGDPSHVTIWGESAGAGSVLQHIVANGGNTQPPLFSGAITSSTFLPSQYNYSDRIPQLMYDEVASMAGCSSNDDTFTCLQEVDASVLQNANYNLSATGFYGSYVFVPVVDGTFIVERPSVTLARGQVNGDILLTVGNSNEGNNFVNANETLNITDYVAQLFPDMTPLQVQEAAYVYQSYGTALEQAITVMGDSIFVCPTYYLLQAFQGRSWKGIFAIPPGYHGNDVAYYFNNPAPPYNNTEFINAFSQSFMSFAMSYDVNAKFDPTNITPYWDEYYIGETEMLFNRTEDYVPSVLPVKTDPALVDRCAFWQTVTQLTAQ
ncbi:Alpha/Beta hydrolase protein [Hygrophoropsis aurantiaca]|uniref:Alpha/Beta hydrolase protein n=1 Tax=Hygrophoropsis aurantiaca TaxID=72124 RepID=A0ACB7ZZK2_9AGAM|nr:Alpha/Beta hydrolase protein [Hygrophoropsis aurantiaca]